MCKTSTQKITKQTLLRKKRKRTNKCHKCTLFMDQKTHHLKISTVSSPNSRCNILPGKTPARLYVCGLKTDSKMYVEIQRAKKSKDKWTGGGILPDIMFCYKVIVKVCDIDTIRQLIQWDPRKDPEWYTTPFITINHHTIYNNHTIYNKSATEIREERLIFSVYEAG